MRVCIVLSSLLFFFSRCSSASSFYNEAKARRFNLRACVVCECTRSPSFFPNNYVLKKKWGTDTKLQKSTLEKISESKEDEDNNGNGPGSF